MNIRQDLRKGHLNGGMLKLRLEIVREHRVLNLIDSSTTCVSNRLQATPNQQGTSNVISLNPSLATLAGFDSSELLQLAVKLLNLPTHTTRILYGIR